MKHCGFITIIGRPNVGKSTLLNRLLGKKIAITSKKPQTTRNRILGIHTTDAAQAIFIDTPGLHRKQKKLLNRYMNETARNAITEGDVVLMMAEASAWQESDDWVMQALKDHDKPCVLALNKMDLLDNKNAVLLLLEKLHAENIFSAIVPISAETGDACAHLLETLTSYLPESDYFCFPSDQITDCSDNFLISECVREKLMRFLGEEVPYSCSVSVEHYEQKPNCLFLHVVIWVERKAQKAIVIGAQGSTLKRIGTTARADIERLLGKKVCLKTWVKVKDAWANDMAALTQLGLRHVDDD